MEMALDATVLFTPHLVPMTRGIFATCYGEATGEGDPLEALKAAYAEEPFVHVTDASPATKWVSGSNGVQVTARYDKRTGRVLAFSAIDNLGKGAAGQMVQCANLMLGLEETAGLTAMRDLSMSVTAAEGFVAAGCHAASRSGNSTWPCSRPRIGSRSLARPSHAEQVRRAASRAGP